MATDDHNLRDRILLLKEEFSKFLVPSHVIYDIQGLNDDFIEDVCNTERISRKESVEKLIAEIANDDNLINKFVWALSDKGYERFTSDIEGQYPNRGDQFSQEYFGFLVNMLRGDLVDKLSSMDVIGFLFQNGCLTEDDYGKISQKRQNDGERAACRELFICLPRLRSNWATIFVEALKNTEGQEYLKVKMDPSATREDLENAGVQLSSSTTGPADTSSQGSEVPNNNDQDVEEMTNQLVHTGLAEPDGDQAGPDSDYEDEKYLKEGSEKGPLKEIELRNYQYELAEKALAGKNTVICADTGSGKTWVALHIVKELLSKGPQKIAFMARTNPLVQQQFNLFKHFIGQDKVYIINKDDKTSIPLKKLLEQYDVFFFTPQILLNNIEKGETKITDFSMLILDECHHTNKGEPYNNLMRKYIKIKDINTKMEALSRSNIGVKLPQIVGLTASIGVGPASDEEGAIKHMIKIFSNLDLEEISMVERNKEEMKKYVAIPTEEHVKMKENFEDPCMKLIVNEMEKVGKKYEQLMKSQKIDNSRYNLPGGSYLTKTYLGSIIKVRNQLMCDQTLEAGREMIACLNHLSYFHEALDINYLMNVEHVVEFLKKKYEEKEDQRNMLIQIEKELLKLGYDLIRKLETQVKGIRNPNLAMLEEKLHELYTGEGVDSLGMIFVQTRATAKSLAIYLNDKLSGIDIPVKSFIGSKASDNDEGLSETEKKALLEDFRNHKIKLLVATSVGSEGIDIPECNIVMKYNYSGNEINIIQMRGRTRKSGGQAIYISDPNVLRRDLVSMERAALMHKSLDRLKMKGSKEIRMLIIQEQQNNLRELEENERKNRDLENSKRRGYFKLQCATCKKTEIEGSKIRTFKQNHHVAADSAFLQKVRIEDAKDGNVKVNKMIKKATFFCKKCPQRLGKIFLIHDLEVPLLKIESFLCVEGEKLKKYKSWKYVPFIIDEIEFAELEQIFPKVAT